MKSVSRIAGNMASTAASRTFGSTSRFNFSTSFKLKKPTVKPDVPGGKIPDVPGGKIPEGKSIAKVDAEPTAKPKVDAEPTAKPDVDAEPTAKPEANAEPTAKPEANAEPTTKSKADAELQSHRSERTHCTPRAKRIP